MFHVVMTQPNGNEIRLTSSRDKSLALDFFTKVVRNTPRPIVRPMRLKVTAS